MGQFSWIVGFLIIRGDVVSWMGRFSVSVTKISLSKFPFVEDENSGGGGGTTSEYHEF